MRMMPTMKILLALALTWVTTAAWAGEPSADVVIGRKTSIESAVLKEKRDYWVYLPPLYDDKLYGAVRYPVLYILDGDAHFHSASGVLQFMGGQNSQIPPMIMVAIPNTDRMRDLTPTDSKTDMRGQSLKIFGTT